MREVGERIRLGSIIHLCYLYKNRTEVHVDCRVVPRELRARHLTKQDQEQSLGESLIGLRPCTIHDV